MRNSHSIWPAARLLVVLPLLALTQPTHASAQPATPRFPTAEEISRKFLSVHPKPRNDAERKIILVMEDMFATQARGMGNILPEDGRMLRMLAESLGARRIVEVGTANGYSAMWFCLALRSTGGKLITHEIDPKRIALARDNFKRADVEDLVTLVEGDAHRTVQRLEDSVDLVLLDAEKQGFTDYLEKLLPRVRIGGLIIAHDSSGQAAQMHGYFRALVANSDLETVFVDASRWGMCITRKMR
ncbi:MAG: class I SAM-dependent methyltransferase [Verrucomicrobia bacterium]|nr:class I SAM-dependent methyltransferase [Verrucomicrobiota bacterium]